jgi:hypothetical protein
MGPYREHASDLEPPAWNDYQHHASDCACDFCTEAFPPDAPITPEEEERMRLYFAMGEPTVADLVGVE